MAHLKNQARFIEKTILSVLEQGYPQLEYIILDAQSTDGTQDILRKYEQQLTWTSEQDEGQSDAINKGFKRSTAFSLSTAGQFILGPWKRLCRGM